MFSIRDPFSLFAVFFLATFTSILFSLLFKNVGEKNWLPDDPRIDPRLTL